MKLLIFLLISLLSIISLAQNESNLILKDIMKGDDFIGHQPNNVSWSIDGSKIYFDWNPNNDKGDFPYKYDLKSKEYNQLSADQFKSKVESNSSHYNTEVYIGQNGLYSYDRKTKKKKQIYITSDRIYNLQRFDENTTFFQLKNSLYSYSLENNSIVEIVQFDKSNEPSEPELSLLEKQELGHFNFLKNDKKVKDFYDAYSETYYIEIPKIYTEGKSYQNVQIDPNQQYIIYRKRIDPSTKPTSVTNFIAGDGNTKEISARSKVSIENDPNHQLCVFNFNSQTTKTIDFSSLTDIRKKPDYLNDTEEYSTDRNIIMHTLKWSPDGKNNIVDIRSYDNKDRWIVSINLETGDIVELNHQHDEAWIGGPGIISWNMVEGTLGWIDNSTIYYQSEETGFSHLYTHDIKSNKRIQLTSGKWEVHEVNLSKDKTKFFLTGNKNHPGNREFYHLIISSKELIPILTEDGFHDSYISPDEKSIALLYSFKNKPTELYIASNKRNAEKIQITHSTTKEFSNHEWNSPEIITIPVADKKDVYARLYSPSEATKNKAAIIFVHGAGYLQNAHNGWSGYHREYMFHNFLREQGFTVLDIDYRASKGYGRDHRTAIYRHMGGKDLSDQLDGKKFLVNSLGIDPERIGIYGGSYGGFITLMALLTEPGEFKCGAALRSVTDWNHYNHEYTSNILNYPETDSTAYYQSSPINFSHNLEDRLLMLHGMVDDNVQFQDVVRLSQKFIEQGKENWELAVFPVERHGFKRADSWADEYRRIYEMFVEELLLKKD